MKTTKETEGTGNTWYMTYENSRYETKSGVSEISELEATSFEELVLAAAQDIDERVKHSWHDTYEMTNSRRFRAWVRDNLDVVDAGEL